MIGSVLIMSSLKCQGDFWVKLSKNSLNYLYSSGTQWKEQDSRGRIRSLYFIDGGAECEESPRLNREESWHSRGGQKKGDFIKETEKDWVENQTDR